MADRGDLRHRGDKSSSEARESSEASSPVVAQRDDSDAAVSRGQQAKLTRWLSDANRTRDELVAQMDAQLGDTLRQFVYNIVFDLEKQSGKADLARLRQVEPNANKTKRVADGENRLFEKQFEMRSSVLTEMLAISHIRTVANMFTAALIIFTLNTLLHDLLEQSSILNIDLVIHQFGNFGDAVILWLQMFIATVLCVYLGFYLWRSQRDSYWRSGAAALAFYDYAFLAAYALYQSVFLVTSLNKMQQLQFQPALSLILVIEQVRLMMKAHAFVRECTRRCLADFETQVLTDSISSQLNKKRSESKVEEEEDEQSVHSYMPHFSHFLYFLFAPTLVYRDSYPRTRSVRWRVVVNYLLQFFGCVIFIHFIIARFCAPTFREYSSKNLYPKQMIIWVFSCMIPGSLCLFLGFYLLLHVWMNMFAEMLRFGDRLFYSDWWNSRTWARYYRTWNIVVHDWLYAYIYRDAYMLLGAKRKVSRTAAMSIVFLISAIFHEYIVALVLGFFYPVLFFSFMGAGFGFIFLTEKGSSPLWNIFMWFCLFVGTGVILCLLSIEWFARRNCQPMVSDPTLDFFIPRTFSCVPISN